MKNADDIAAFIARQPEMMAQLAVVERLQLADCWVGAGFVRKAVWNELSGKPYDSNHADIDVVYFDRSDTSWTPEENAERQLQEWLPGVPWSVKNQARMHEKKGHSPYKDTAEGLANWTETCTAVAACLQNGIVKILAPYGVEDLLNMVVRPTPYSLTIPDTYRDRLATKNWQAIWPQLTFIAL